MMNDKNEERFIRFCWWYFVALLVLGGLQLLTAEAILPAWEKWSCTINVADECVQWSKGLNNLR